LGREIFRTVEVGHAERGPSVAEGDKDRFDRVGGMSDICGGDAGSVTMKIVGEGNKQNRVDIRK